MPRSRSASNSCGSTRRIIPANMHLKRTTHSSPESLRRSNRRGSRGGSAGLGRLFLHRAPLRCLVTRTVAQSAPRRKVTGANFLALAPLFVAPTDAEAENIVSAVSVQMRPFALKRVEGGGAAPARLTSESLADFSIFGSPRTVSDKLAHILSGCGARRFMAIVRFRGTSTEIVRQTQRLFAEEVAPALRKLKTLGQSA